MEMTSKKKVLNIFAIVIAVVLALYMVSMIVPVFWTLMTTLKHTAEYEGTMLEGVILEKNQLWWPKYGLTFENYVTAYQHCIVRTDTGAEVGIFAQFVNSILYAVGCALSVTLVSMVMGYASARYSYRMSSWLYLFVLITMALPVVGSMPSEIAVAKKLNIHDTMFGMWIMRGTFLNTYFLIFFAQFKMIPRDYTEAARIDGANPFVIMTQIIVPLAMGTVTTVFVLAFIGLWNDFQIPLLYIPSYPVAAVGMYHFQIGNINEINKKPIQVAGVFLMAMPIVVFYGIFNKKLNVNLSVGGIKG